MDKEQLLIFWKKAGIVKNKKLLDAFRKIKREDFVLKEYRQSAYEDLALPLIKGSTISQPSTIMIMLEALDLRPGNKVLEIGTGSGYTAALISEIIGPKGDLYTLDIIPELIEVARKNLIKMKNTKIFCKDGSGGLKKFSPYDRIIVNAAAKEIPKKLISQLKINGIMIMPIGPEYHQKIIKFTKEKNKIKEEYLGDFVFIPLKQN